MDRVENKMTMDFGKDVGKGKQIFIDYWYEFKLVHPLC